MKKKGRRHRDRDQLVIDAAFVLTSPLSYGSKYALLDDICWKWSEFEGKVIGCRFWSGRAFQDRQAGTEVIFDHVVPRRVVIQQLFDLPTATPDSVRQVLQKYCLAAVITPEEDNSLSAKHLRQKMPSDWDRINVWARYDAVDIRVVDVTTQEHARQDILQDGLPGSPDARISTRISNG